ncbi:MAG: lysine--tRNA ligase [Thaumarchaeota archaeon]|nr:lysine--tRNA ligase [Nitrososphaerota archaeon]
MHLTVRTSQRCSRIGGSDLSSDTTQIVGRGTWLDKVAKRIVEREQKLERSLQTLNVESGLGASGIPHVGSIGDAVRAYGVKLALQDIGCKSKLIAYSDDLDGLRKIPEGLPDWLTKYIAKPVSTIPDPFDCHKSYGAHMSSMLLDGLDKLEIGYTFQSGAEAYKSGLLDKQIETILQNAEKIGKKIAEMLGQTKFEKVLPYYPICANCGRIYVAQAYQYIPEEKKVLYKCIGAEIRKQEIEGCNHSGEGKLSWKGAFAARGAALDIRFEAYGKDIADSVHVNDWISDEILKFHHPSHVRYELFLDKSGKKISKSLGNVFTPQTWFLYGTPQSLMLLMFKRIKGTRNLSVEDIPNYMDELDSLEDIYFGKVKEENEQKRIKLRGLFEYVHKLSPPQKSSQHVPYRLLVQLAAVAPTDDLVGYIERKLSSYGMLRQADDLLKVKIALARRWAEDFSKLEREKVILSELEAKCVSELAKSLSGEIDQKTLQSEIFEIAKRNSIEPAQFFKTLYRVLLGSERGPRLGPYIMDIGKDKVREVLEAQLPSAAAA